MDIFEIIFSEGRLILKANSKREALEKLCQIEAELELLLDKSIEVQEMVDQQHADEQLKKAPKISEFLKKIR